MNGQVSYISCAHGETEPMSGVFGLMKKCDLCQSRIWNVLNVVKCTDCSCVLHGSCAFNNLRSLIAQDSAERTGPETYTENETSKTTKASCFARARNERALILEKKAFDSMAPEERRAAEREIRARKAIERRDAMAKNDETPDRRSKNTYATKNVTTNATKNSAANVMQNVRAEMTRDAKAGSTNNVTVNAPSRREMPTPEIDPFVVSKWARENFYDGRPAPALTSGVSSGPATMGHGKCGPLHRRKCGPSRDRNPAQYRAWADGTEPDTTADVKTNVGAGTMKNVLPVNAPSWRDRPAPEIDHFVVSKWVRKTFCGGRPAPPFVRAVSTGPAPVGHGMCGPSRDWEFRSQRDLKRGPSPVRKPAEYRAWAAPQTTHLLDTSVPPTAVPAPPGPGPHWWGRQAFGPFTGPLMWHPVHAGPRSFERPELNTSSSEEEQEERGPPFSFDVPGYLDGVQQPALFKVTVTP